jgi:uncharacterized protein YbjT (DUF2867 family)
MKTALIIGGTGLTGRKLYHQLCADKRYSVVRLLVRKPINSISTKLEQIEFDFENPNASLVKGHDVFCCLGTTIKDAGNREQFFKVEHQYVITLAKMAFANGTQNFAYISATGASKKSLFYYNKVKAAVEISLQKIGFKTLLIVRPSLLLGTRNKARFGENIAKLLATNFSFLLPARLKPIKSSQVAAAMIAGINTVNGICVIESHQIETIASRGTVPPSFNGQHLAMLA